MNKQASSCFLLALVMMLALQVVTTTPTYEPAPPVNVSDLFTFHKSQVGSRVIGSKRVQALEISHTTNSSGPITEFKITYLNRSATLSTSKVEFGALGQWQYVMGTQDSLSCSIVYESNIQSYSVLRFDLEASPEYQLIMIPPISWAEIRDYMLALGQTITKEMIPQILQVGNGCEVGYIGTAVFRIIDDLTAVKILTMNNTAIQAKTESFNYGIVNNKLYRYNQDTLQYQQIYNFPKFQDFTMRQMQGRLLIIGSNATVNTSLGMEYKVKQNIYVFEDKQIGFTKKLTLIKALEYNGFSFQRSFRVTSSPQLSKFGFGYTPLDAPTSDDVVIVAKSVDYLNSKVVDLEFVDVDAYMQIASQSNGLFDFNDNFLVLRSSALEIQAAYQFVGNKITGFAERSLTGDIDIDTCVNILVDPYFKSTLVALVVHQVPEGYLIKQVQYGNYAATRRIVQPPPQSFIKFQIPPGDRINGAPEWTWFSSDGTDSVLQVFRINEEETSHFERITTTINFGQAVKASSPNCALVYEAGASKFAILRKDPTTGIFTRTDITSSLVGVIETSQFLISERCDRLTVDNDIYYRSSPAGQFTKVNQNFQSPSFDRNISYVADGYAIFRFNPSTKEFETSFKEPSGIEFLPNTVIDSFNNRVVVYSLSKEEGQCPCADGVSLEYSAFIDKGGKLSLVGKGSLMWDGVPKIKLSSGLTKAIATGWINQVYEVKAIHFDYSALKNVSIIVPLDEVVRLQRFMLFQVYDSFIYIRQLPDPSKSADTTYTSVSNKQFVYFLSQDYLPRQILQRKIPITSEAAWKKTFIISKNNISALFTESMINEASKDHVVVDKSEIDPKQASITEGSTGGTGAFIKDGKVILCSPGCTDCTSGACTECNTGFAFEPNAATCQPCANGCSICDPADPKKCTDCYNGFVLQGNTCTRCDPKCISCAVTPTSCLQCQHGEYFSAGDMCQKCPANCDSCSVDGTLKCDVCRRGFTKAPNGKCRGCSIDCSSCEPGDITACTSCAAGLQLVSSKCVPCPDKCQVCNGDSCQQCAPGYNPNTAGKCILNCIMPCATCADNQPSVCTSCFGSSVLSGGKCNIDKSCNQTGTCTDCGVGLNFYLFEGKCYPCSTIANIDGCIQCSWANQQLCSLCKGGYYLEIEGSCSKCPDSCKTCFGQGLCTSCQLGYTLPQSKTQGPCLQCIPPCLTCAGIPNYCTSCMSGYTKRVWKCQNDNYVGFVLKFKNHGVSDIKLIIDEIIDAILTAAGQTTDLQSKRDQVTIEKIETGSASATGSYSPSSGTVGSAATTLSAGLSSVTAIGTLPVAPITYSVYSSSESQQQSEDKKGLIIGVVIGALVFIVLAVLAFICIYRFRKNQLGMRVLEANGSMIQQEATPSEPINPQVQVAHVSKNVQIVDMEGPNKGSHAEFALEKEIEIN